MGETHEQIRIHAWLDAWCLGCARFDWGGGPVWGWDGLISGQRSVLRLVPDSGGAAVFAAWPDRRWDVTATDACLVLHCEGRSVEGLPLDGRTFLIDRDDPDTPTATFGGFDDDGRPGVLYEMLWGLPRA